MLKSMEWEFPLPRTHTGMLQGNATLGTMIWGEGNLLKITLGRADFWDHRGGMPWTERQSYKRIRACLEAGDEAGLRALFTTQTDAVPGQPSRPSVIPVGRVDLRLPEGAVLTRGALDLATGAARVFYLQGGREESLVLHLAMDRCVVAATVPAGCACELLSVPAWEFKGEYFESISMEAPTRLTGEGVAGWVQPLPEDPALGVFHVWDGNTVWVGTARGDSVETTVAAGQALLATATTSGLDALVAANQEWWAAYWASVPAVEVPNETLARLYAYGMYKFACFTQPEGVAGTLQGPWIEEYELPPWSSDYHFNINVQMCYWPAFKGGRLEHLRPLFDLIFSWEETLRHNARVFLGIEDGFMLPHAVDDRCVCMGGFWTGCIDHGCTAWVAQMMYDYARYSCDEVFLRERAFPFMVGTMRVYEEMLERTAEGFILPVSVSPEYRGAALNAWGANASFQLACIHRLCENLLVAAERLGEPARPIWREVLVGLPKVCLTPDGRRIGLWEGVDLEESHRHHSHLAAICPFDTIDIYSPAWQTIVSDSVTHWVVKGTGLWSGWCVPWASMLHARLGNGDMAELLIEIFERVYTNQGHGTLHDCEFYGFTAMGASRFGGPGSSHGIRLFEGLPREIMQLDGGMGAVVAVQDMLMHSRRGVVHVFPGVPPAWKHCAFGPMLCEGGFRISAVRQDRTTVSVTVRATHSGTLKLASPWTGEVLDVPLAAGEERVLTPPE